MNATYNSAKTTCCVMIGRNISVVVTIVEFHIPHPTANTTYRQSFAAGSPPNKIAMIIAPG